MVYEGELHLLQAAFKKCRVQSLVVSLTEPLDERFDLGRRLILQQEGGYDQSFAEWMPELQKATIYKMRDSFGCHYLFFLLPEVEQLLLMGPYLGTEPSREKILEYMEKNQVSHSLLAEMEQYYGELPILRENSHLFVLLDAFAERLWGGAERFSVEEIEGQTLRQPLELQDKKDSADPRRMMWNMQRMEERYAYENEMMQAVSRGQVHKAEMLMNVFSGGAFEKRLSDPIRNMKNYCIIMNTILRKSAERGGVHPLYLDRMSSAFARKIELVTSNVAIEQLMNEMFRSYCLLVREHAMKNYSAPIRKTIVYIDSDLSADLSLGTLAELQNVSAAYLSSLFRKETGQTLTDHVTAKRVELAKHMLATTDLQVQTVAQHCGILDVHYFSRVFKKYTGQTPKEYRASL